MVYIGLPVCSHDHQPFESKKIDLCFRNNLCVTILIFSSIGGKTNGIFTIMKYFKSWIHVILLKYAAVTYYSIISCCWARLWGIHFGYNCAQFKREQTTCKVPFTRGQNYQRNVKRGMVEWRWTTQLQQTSVVWRFVRILHCLIQTTTFEIRQALIELQ